MNRLEGKVKRLEASAGIGKGVGHFFMSTADKTAEQLRTEYEAQHGRIPDRDFLIMFDAHAAATTLNHQFPINQPSIN